MPIKYFSVKEDFCSLTTVNVNKGRKNLFLNF